MVKKLLLSLALLSSAVFAAVPEWEIIPGESKITFTGTQNDAPTTGSFKKFTGEIKGDPNNFANASVRIKVDIASVSMTFKDFNDTLLTPEWFDAKAFPQAIFEAHQFKKLENNHYQGEGTLTIRDKSIPLTVTFTAEELSKSKGQVKGSAIIKRTEFGVGQGEWSDTKEVKDEVTVQFEITANRK